MSGSDQTKLADLARLRRARDRMDRDYAQPRQVGELRLVASGHVTSFSRAQPDSPLALGSRFGPYAGIDD